MLVFYRLCPITSLALRQLENIDVRVCIMMDLFVGEFWNVKGTVHEISTKVEGRVVGGKGEATGAEFFERKTGGVGELADDGFAGSVVPTPVTVPLG